MPPLEGGSYCVLAPSGLSAVSLVDMAFLRQGDELLIPDNAYGPNKSFASGELAAWGITHRFYDAQEPARSGRQDRAIPPAWSGWKPRDPSPWNTRICRPWWRWCNDANAQAAEGTRAIVTALDNTWGAGIAFDAFELGVDVSMQALTKYPSGGADVLMGSVVTRDERLHRQLLMTHMRLGLGVSGNDTELVLRGLPSMALRYQAQDASTRALATWMQSQPGVVQVLAPGLAGFTRSRNLGPRRQGRGLPVQRGL